MISRNAKKILAMIMVIAMVFSMMPLEQTAFAGNEGMDNSESLDLSIQSISDDDVPTVTYNFVSDGKTVDTQIVKTGDTLYEPEAPVKGGETFLGWFDGDNKFEDFGIVETISETKEVTLTAKFDKILYVIFMDGTGEDAKVIETRSGTTGQEIKADFKYSFGNESAIGWYTDKGLTDIVSSVTLNDKNVTLYPKMESGNWITFDSKGGSYVEPVFVASGTNAVAPANPTKPGFSFVEWVIAETSVTFAFGSTLTGDVKLEAKWNAGNANYTVIHWQENANDDGYSFKESETMTDAVVGQETAAVAREYDGFKAQTIKQETINGDGSTIVNVYYKRNEYSVKFYEYKVVDRHWLLGAIYDWVEISGKRITAKHGANIDDKWPTDEGVLWAVEKNGSVYQAGIETMPLNGDEFYKESTSGKYTIRSYYHVQGLDGNYVEDHRDEHKSDNTSWHTTKEDHYPITGFTYTNNIQDGSSFKREGNTNVYSVTFKYSRNSYDVLFMNNGAKDKTSTLKYEEAVGKDITGYAPTNKPAGKENYVFAGWYDNEGGYGTPYTFPANMPANNITVYAKWAAPEVKVTAYDSMDNSAATTNIPTAYGGIVDKTKLPTVNVPKGSKFIGWSTVRGEFKEFNFNTQIYKDTVLYPYYISADALTVTYDLNGGTGTDPVDGKTYAQNAHAVVLGANGVTAPTGKVFLGWNTNSAANTAAYQPGSSIQVTEAITLYAIYGYVASAVTLTYVPNYPEGVTDEPENAERSFSNNSTVIIETVETVGFTPEGYNFTGWNTAADGKGKSYTAGQKVMVDNNGENKLYAQWEKAANQLPVKIFVLNPQRGTPTNGDDQGRENYYPADGDNGIAAGNYLNIFTEDGLTALRGADGRAAIGDQIFAQAGIGSNLAEAFDTVIANNRFDIMNAFGITDDSKYVIVPYVAKVQTGAGKITGTDENGAIADIHIDCWIKNVEVNVTYHQNHNAADAKTFVEIATTGKNYTVKTGIAETTGIAAPEGYTFDGWYLDKATTGEKQDGKTEMLTTEKHLYAKWVERTDVSYTVNYYEQGTTNKVADSKIVENQTFGATVTENAIDIEGYNKVEPTIETITLKVEGNVINFYYTKRADISYIVNYYEEGTTTKVADSKTVENQTFGATVKENAIEVEGYEKVEPTTKTLKLEVNGNEINFYYTKRTDISYTVNYYEQGTTNKVADSKIVENQTFGATVTENAIDIEGYNKVEPTIETITLKVEGNVINFYYTKRADISYIVNYYEDGTANKVADSKIVENQTFGATVTENAIDIEGYNKVEPTIETITLKVEGNVINFYYTKRADISYIVNYYEEGTTTKVADSKVVGSQTFGKRVFENAIEVEGYEKVEPTTKTLKLEVNGNEINFYYTKRTDISYTVNYYEQGTTNKVADSKIVENQTFGATVTENAIDIEGYNKVEPTIETITLKVEGNVINFYYTKRADISYIVNYYEDGTANKVADSKIVENQTFGATVTENAIDIEGYNKVEPTIETITLKVEGNVINFYYTKRTDISYTVNYYEQGTTTKVAESKVVENQTFGAEVTEEAIDVDGYNKVDPTTETITLKVEGNVINFYYTKRTDISYTVNYYEQGTTTKVAESKVVENQTFGAEVTEEAIDVDGYNKVDPTTETITLKVEGNVINFYYTKRTDISYTVNYYEQGTTTKVAESKVVENQTFGAEVTEEAIDVDGYNKVDPTTETITLKVEGNVINFYYTKRTDISYTVNYYEQGTTTKVAESKVVENQTFGAEVTEEAIDVDGYNKVDPTTETITLKVEGNVINFYYTKRTDISYTVNYYEQGTTTKVAESKVVENQTFGAEVTEEAIDVDGYNKVDPTTETITLKVEGNVINFYYTKRTDISYTVNYYEQGTTTKVAESKVVENQTFGAEVTEEAIDVDGYNKVDPTTETITLKVEGNVINFYYTKRTDISYTVNYYEQGTTTKVAESKIIENQTFGAEVTEEAIDVDGYNKVDPTTETITLKVEGNVINFYYSRKSYTVTYVYDTTAPANASTPPAEATYKFEQEVTVEPDATAIGYKFLGWKATEVTPDTNGKFKMPASNVVFTGSFEKDEDQRHNLSYTVEYYKDGEKVEEDTQVVEKDVWINDTTLAVDDIPGFENKYDADDYYFYKIEVEENSITTEVDGLPAKISDKGIIKLYYVNKDTVILKANSDEFVYDGTEKTVSSFVDGFGLKFTREGKEYTISGIEEPKASGTNVGTYDSIIVVADYKIEDSEGNDVTKKFKLLTENGILTVTPRPITVTSATNSKTYDGIALTDANYINDVLVGGHTIDVKVTGTITNYGTVNNTIESVKILNGTEDVTANYMITEVEGKLSIEKRPVTITVANDSKYTNQDDPAFVDATMEGNVAGELGEIDLSVTRTNATVNEAGVYTDVLVIGQSKAELEALYTNYVFTVVPGTFVIHTYVAPIQYIARVRFYQDSVTGTYLGAINVELTKEQTTAANLQEIILGLVGGVNAKQPAGYNDGEVVSFDPVAREMVVVYTNTQPGPEPQPDDPIDDEPIPGGETPVDPQPTDPQPTEPQPDEEFEDDDVPGGDLPFTGGLTAPVFYGLGALAIASGLFVGFRKKKEEDDEE